jgi:hypothetical protein
MSVGGGRSKDRVKQEGTLYLNFINPGSNALIWQGSATATLKEQTSPEEQQQRIDQIIAELLKNFPPKGK